MIKNKTLLMLIISIGLSLSAKAKVIYTEVDSVLFQKYCTDFHSKKNLPLADIVTQTALHFQNIPYVAATLESSADKEDLVINLRQLDCTTFVENCISLSQMIKSGDCSFNNYCRLLQNMRYRNGNIEDYSSRLHYASDWIYENEKRGIYFNLSKQLGGTLIDRQVGFMSTHPQAYLQLKDNETLQKKIKIMEDSLNKREGFYVIRKQDIGSIEQKIKNGDIILFSTTINVLDFSHMGIAYVSSGCVSFIHASSTAKKVTIEKRTLLQYCNDQKRCDGITVMRLK